MNLYALYCFLLLSTWAQGTPLNVSAVTWTSNDPQGDIHLIPSLNFDLTEGSVTDITYPNVQLVDTASKKRTDVKACLRNVWSYAVDSTSISNSAAAWYAAIAASAGSAKDQSTYHNCGIVSQYVDNGQFRYVYSAGGNNCDTTAEGMTIRGAVDKAFDNYIKAGNSGIWCISLSHGGSWSGHLLLGPSDNPGWNYNIGCSPMYTDSCVSGGVNDVRG